MIRIDRSTAKAPAVLGSEGKEHLKKLRRRVKRGTLRSKHLLDRDDLVEMRGTHYRKVVQPLLERWRDHPAQRPQWLRDARELADPNGAFSAMVRAAFRLAGIL